MKETITCPYCLAEHPAIDPKDGNADSDRRVEGNVYYIKSRPLHELISGLLRVAEKRSDITRSDLHRSCRKRKNVERIEHLIIEFPLPSECEGEPREHS